MKLAPIAAFLIALPAVASGPVAPDGWNGSNEETLPNGQPCCQSADLNGIGLVGGAIVLLSDSKKEFGLFALSYLAPSSSEEHWQLLERHPISELATYRVTVEPRSKVLPFGAITACTLVACKTYFTTSANQRFKPTGHASGAAGGSS